MSTAGADGGESEDVVGVDHKEDVRDGLDNETSEVSTTEVLAEVTKTDEVPEKECSSDGVAPIKTEALPEIEKDVAKSSSEVGVDSTSTGNLENEMPKSGEEASETQSGDADDVVADEEEISESKDDNLHSQSVEDIFSHSGDAHQSSPSLKAGDDKLQNIQPTLPPRAPHSHYRSDSVGQLALRMPGEWNAGDHVDVPSQSLPRGRAESYSRSSLGSDDGAERAYARHARHVTLDGSALSFPVEGSIPSPLPCYIPTLPPEIMRLVDSAIHGNNDGLYRLRTLVSGGALDMYEMDSPTLYDAVQSVVDVLIAKMGMVEEGTRKGDSGPPQVLLSAGAARVAAELIPWLPWNEETLGRPSPRTRMANALLAMLRSCTRNRAMCSAAGLLQVLLQAALYILCKTNTDDAETAAQGADTVDTKAPPVAPPAKEADMWDCTPLMHCLETLGAHSLSVKDLREWLSASTEATRHGHGADFILGLERAIGGEEGRGPANTFEFDGESSGLLGPGDSKWPFTNGYAFATWLYIESFADSINAAAAAAAVAAAATAKAGKASPTAAAAVASALAGEGTSHMPRLFSFLTADNQGVEAYFHQNFLVVEIGMGKAKKASFHFHFAFRPHKWYFIVLEHSTRQASLLSRVESEVKLYVDGRVIESRQLEFPRVTKPLAFCCIGTNPPAAMAGLQRRRRQCPLFAEMGPIYIFKDSLGPERVAKLHARGGDYLPTFGVGAGVPWLANNDIVMAMAEEYHTMDLDLGPRLHLLYHPRLLVGRSCPDASPAGAAGGYRRPAEVLGHVHVASRAQPADAIWAMGEWGPMALLPMVVGYVEKENLQPVLGDPALSAAAATLAGPLFRVLGRAARHPGNMEELVRANSPRLLSHVLAHLLSVPASGSKLQKEARDEELVAGAILLSQSAKANENLKIHLYSTLLLDLKLWSRCGYALQKKLLSSLADMVFTEAAAMRGANAVQLLLDGCRRCYWLIPEQDSIQGPPSHGRSSRNVGEINTLVDELLVVVELLVGSSQGSQTAADVRCLVHFVLDCPQPNQVARVLHLIYRLVVQPNTSRAATFAELLLGNGGAEMLLTLMRREAELGETPAWSPPKDTLRRDSFPSSGRSPSGLQSTEGPSTPTKSSANNSPRKQHSPVPPRVSVTPPQDPDTPEPSPTPPKAADGLNPSPAPPKSSDSPRGSPHASAPADGDSLRRNGTAKAGVPPPLPLERRGGQSFIRSISSAGGGGQGWMPNMSNPVSPGWQRKSPGGVALSISPDNLKNSFRNVDGGDGVMVGVINLLGALVTSGHLRLANPTLVGLTGNEWNYSSGPVSPPEKEKESNSSGAILASAQLMGAWLVYGLQRAFQAGPTRLMTDATYASFLSAVLRSDISQNTVSSVDGRLSLYDIGHRFEQTELLGALIRALPHAPRPTQQRALQDLLLLASSNGDNRKTLMMMPEWPEWLFEMLLTEFERGFNLIKRPSPSASRRGSAGPGEVVAEARPAGPPVDPLEEKRMAEAEGVMEMAYSFFSIMLEHSMRKKDGWREVEAAFHCLEWMAVIGPTAMGEQGRNRREAAVPVIKRRLLGNLLDFSASELQLQTQIVAAAAAGVAAEGLSPRAAKAEAEFAAQECMYLADNSLVLIMLLEDFLRMQCQYFGSGIAQSQYALMYLPHDASDAHFPVYDGPATPRLETGGDKVEGQDGSRRASADMGQEGLSIEMLATMADENGQITAAAMERIAASAAAEPYESVRCSLASFGSCGLELAQGWRRRSRMWYGVGLPVPGTNMGGGGGGWSSWMTSIIRNEKGEWVEMGLLKKAIAMLRALLLDETGPGGTGMGGGGFGAGAGTGAGGIQGLSQLLDSDQPFFCMLRLVLVAMREEEACPERVSEEGEERPHPSNQVALARKKRLMSLLWSVLAPLLTVPITDTKRQRVLVAVCIMYSEVWHAVDTSHVLQRTQFMEMLIPPFAALLRRWRPLLSGIHELTDADGRSPLAYEDRALATDALPAEAALAMVSPAWAATFASPPAAMALSMAAAGAGGGDNGTPSKRGPTPLQRQNRLPIHQRTHTVMGGGDFDEPNGGSMSFNERGGDDSRLLSRNNTSAGSFSGGQYASSMRFSYDFDAASSRAPADPKGPAIARSASDMKAQAAAAAREKERREKIGSHRGLGAVAMATASLRRGQGDKERGRRTASLDAMNAVWHDQAGSTGLGGGWMEAYLNGITPSMWAHALAGPGSGLSGTQAGFLAVMEMVRRMRYNEYNRRTLLAAAEDFGLAAGAHGWRSLMRRLIETDSLFGVVSKQTFYPKVYWKLDTMENSSRMRRRMKRNYNGTDHLGAGESVEDEKRMKAYMDAAVSQGKDGDLPAGAAAQLAPEEVPVEDGEEDAPQQEQGETDSTKGHERVASDASLDGSATAEAADGPSETNQAGPVGSGSSASGAALAAVAQAMLTEPKEKLLLETPAAMVQPMRVMKGRFQVTTKRICFVIDDRVKFTEAGVPGEDPESFDWDTREEDSIAQRSDGARDRSWPLMSLRELHSRRYLLRRSALELFTLDKSNMFFNFASLEERRRVYRTIVQTKPPHLNNIYAGTQRPERLFRRSQLMERWVRREITNFDYLMQLNTLAGRSYNDMTQYPVFPWILADYTSETLDLNNPAVFRDLSKPVGALNPTRLQKFMERYNNFDDPVIPKFHYGSHYSSAGTVLHYLVRMEPFSTLAISLQGGKFDHADRMFSDIQATWDGVLTDMSDVKELTPEFFYFPEMFVNTNDLDLGLTQRGSRLGDVKLPPWALNPVDFVRKHRAALESEYVSQHLHDWIDLIFGYKQRGKDAQLAHNVFFYMTYEGAVDIDKIADPIMRKATQDQIAYFGQTPSQLLVVPHPKRMPINDVLHLQTIFRNPAAVQSYAIPNQERLNVPASKICVTLDSVLTVDLDAPACHVAIHQWQPNTPDGKGAPFMFRPGRSGASAAGGAIMRTLFSTARPSTDTGSPYPRVSALPAPGIKKANCVAVTPDGKFLITGGHADYTVKLVSAETGRVLESAAGHCAPITCLALSPDGSTLVTGSRDATVIVWRLHSSRGASSSEGVSDAAMVAVAAAARRPSDATAATSADHHHDEGVGSPLATESDRSPWRGHKRRLEGPLHVLRGHMDALVCCAVSADMDIVASCSRGRPGVLLHSIMRGRMLRTIPKAGRGDAIALSSDGLIITWDKVTRILRTSTINGVIVASATLLPGEGDISAMVVSADGLHLAIGTDCSKVGLEARFGNSRRTSFNGSNGLGSSEHAAHDKEGSTDSILADLSRKFGPSFSNDLEGDRSDDSSEEEESSFPRNSRVRHGEGLVSGLSPTAGWWDRDPMPCIMLLELYTFKMMHRFRLDKGQDVTALALTEENTNMVVSTADGRLHIYTDPALSVKVVDQMLKLGWEGGGLSGLLT